MILRTHDFLLKSRIASLVAHDTGAHAAIDCLVLLFRLVPGVDLWQFLLRGRENIHGRLAVYGSLVDLKREIS